MVNVLIGDHAYTSSTSHLRIFVIIAYENNQLHYLSEPAVANTEPLEDTLTFSLAPGNNYHYRVAYVR